MATLASLPVLFPELTKNKKNPSTPSFNLLFMISGHVYITITAIIDVERIITQQRLVVLHHHRLPYNKTSTNKSIVNTSRTMSLNKC